MSHKTDDTNWKKTQTDLYITALRREETKQEAVWVGSKGESFLFHAPSQEFRDPAARKGKLAVKDRI